MGLSRSSQLPVVEMQMESSDVVLLSVVLEPRGVRGLIGALRTVLSRQSRLRSREVLTGSEGAERELRELREGS